MFKRESEAFTRVARTGACIRGLHPQCPHLLGIGGGINPRRLRLEAGVILCACECHESCPLAGDAQPAFPARLTVPTRAWLESCACPGADAERTRLEQAGTELPDFDALRAKSRQKHQSRRDAFEAAKAQAAGKTREEVKELYLAELRARGQELPSQEILDANVAALNGDYLPVARLIGRAVISSAKLFHATHRNQPPR
jgi:hypothetical protein